jgi:hypothetical protein
LFAQTLHSFNAAFVKDDMFRKDPVRLAQSSAEWIADMVAFKFDREPKN